MKESKEITLKGKQYIRGVIIESSVLSILWLALFCIFDFSIWILWILIAIQLICVVLNYSSKVSDVTINSSGILIDNNHVKWDTIESIEINSIYGSEALELVIMKKNLDYYEVPFFPMPISRCGFVIDQKIRILSGNLICPQASFWVRFNYPICKCIIALRGQKFNLKS